MNINKEKVIEEIYNELYSSELERLYALERKLVTHTKRMVHNHFYDRVSDSAELLIKLNEIINKEEAKWKTYEKF